MKTNWNERKEKGKKKVSERILRGAKGGRKWRRKKVSREKVDKKERETNDRERKEKGKSKDNEGE